MEDDVPVALLAPLAVGLPIARQWSSMSPRSPRPSTSMSAFTKSGPVSSFSKPGNLTLTAFPSVLVYSLAARREAQKALRLASFNVEFAAFCLLPIPSLAVSSIAYIAPQPP